MNHVQTTDLHQRNPETDRRGQAHGVLEIEKVRTMANRLQFGGNGAHDRDHDMLLQARVDRVQRVETPHESSHIRSRHSNRATGLLDDSARVCALAIRCAT